MPKAPDLETVYQGRFLRVVKRGDWEFATRTKATGVVAIVALHDDGRVVLVEQDRPPVDAHVIELPSGLAGDTSDDETLLDAAKRELEEETGYTAREWTRLLTGLSSAGLTDEAITFYLAEGLSKTAAGGGVGSESIKVHEVALQSLPSWLESMTASNRKIDMKLLAGIYAATCTKGNDSK